MDSLKPLKLEKWETQGIKIHWSDGHISEYRSGWLRARCPCASCQEEANKPGQPRQVTQWLRHVARRLPANQRDVARLEPRNHGVVETGRFATGVERTEGVLPSPPAPAQEERVAGSDPHAGLGFPRLEVLDEDSLAGLEIRHALEPGDVVQHAARHDPVLHRQDRVLPGATFHRDGVGHRIAVPHLAVEEAVPEPVDVSGAGTVNAGIRDPVGGAAGRRVHHLPGERTGVVDGAFELRRRRKRHGHPFLHQRGGRPAFCRGDQVERAQLILGSPAILVRQLREPAVVLRLRHERVIAGALRPGRSHHHRDHPRDTNPHEHRARPSSHSFILHSPDARAEYGNVTCTRPRCPDPQVATCTDSGSIDAARNFARALPEAD